jgi:hypothetical protein
MLKILSICVSYISSLIKVVLILLYKLLKVTAVLVIISAIVYYVYERYFSPQAQYERVYLTYNDIIRATGQSQDALPLAIMDSNIDNAYNDGNKVIITTEFIRRHSLDSIALILGHEVAHGMLGKIYVNGGIVYKMHKGVGINYYLSVSEALADKMGALYAIKAGYDVCEGRKVFLEWVDEEGCSLGQPHPDHVYRYEQLNINCD